MHDGVRASRTFFGIADSSNDLDLLSYPFFRADVLLDLPVVGIDDLIRRGNDVLCRPVVLLQLERANAMLFEVTLVV